MTSQFLDLQIKRKDVNQSLNDLIKHEYSTGINSIFESARSPETDVKHRSRVSSSL